MVARQESWSRRADPVDVALAGAVAVVVFFLAWGVLHHGFYTHRPIVDTPSYRHYGDAVVRGQMPYRDFALEYPPAALPVFVLPALGRPDQAAYDRRFQILMALCGAAMVAFLAVALGALGTRRRRAAGALLFAALAPLALGSLVLSRFDLWPAALTIGALAALLAGRERLGFGTLALGAAAKLYPALLLPPALVYVARRQGARAAAACLAAFVAVAAACVLPFAVLAPDGVLDSITRQAGRPLQLESLGSAFLLAAHQLAGLHLKLQTSSGSQNLVGHAAHELALSLVVVQGIAVVAIWLAFALGPATRERLAAVSAASVAAFVAFGKVLSPQFLIWLIPLVPLVRGRRGLAATTVLGVALVLTQLWFPYRYWQLALGFEAVPSWLVVARDLVLVALVAALVVAVIRRGPEPPRS
ncbi:MAG: glycosyltransferase 87 family protein [Gaiellaceae bacterium]